MVGGCGSGSAPPFAKDLVPATGRVTVNGSPLAGATVTFSPDISVAGGRHAMAVTDAEGMYEMVTLVPGASQSKCKGVLPGEYVVSISRIALPDGAQLPEDVIDEGEALAQGAKQLVPARFTNPNNSPLKVTAAPPNAENHFDL
ncbi:MAG: hypothetical protein U1E05_27615 [Patescibacteria group bacterium]|nr:hypothetical protein [Patescibacteria group bacterium]